MEANLFKLQDILKEINATKGLDVGITKTLYECLVRVNKLTCIATKEVLASNSYAGMLEELLTSKYLQFTKSLMSITIDIFANCIRNSPGHACRNLLTNMLTLANSKTVLNSSRECIIHIVGLLMEYSFTHCCSMMNEVFGTLLSLIKAHETHFLRTCCITTIVKCVIASGAKHADLYLDLLKIVSKYAHDMKSKGCLELRIQISILFYEIVKNGYRNNLNGLTSDYLISFSNKGLEDESSIVQGNYCKAVAHLWVLRMKTYLLEQEELKLAVTRDGGEKDVKKGGLNFLSQASSKAMTSKLGNSISSLLNRKVAMEELNFKNIVSHFLKQCSLPTTRLSNSGSRMGGPVTISSSMKAAYFNILGQFLNYCVADVALGSGAVGVGLTVGSEEEQSDFEWLVQSIIELTNTPAANVSGSGGIAAGPLSPSGPNQATGLSSLESPSNPSTSTVAIITPEESAMYRTRVAVLLRTHVSMNLTEVHQLSLVKWILKYTMSMDARTDVQLQVALGELSQLVLVLGEAIGSICDDIYVACLMLLRSSSLNVRLGAAAVLNNMCISLSSQHLAEVYVRDAIEYCSKEMSVFAAYASGTNGAGGDEIENDGLDPDRLSPVRMNSGNNASSVKVPKIHLFHGYCLLMAQLVKHFPCQLTESDGLSGASMGSVFEFGVRLLLQDIRIVPTSSGRRFICALIRCGCLLTTSCVSLGYKSFLRNRLCEVVQNCGTLLLMVEKSKHVNAVPVADSGANGTLVVGAGGVNTSAMANATTASAAAAAAATLASTQQAENNMEIMYEMTVLEAALTTFAAIEYSCPEALLYEESCLINVVNSLDLAHQLMQDRYAPLVRNQSRYRHVQAIMLECYAWLPPGSFPNSIENVFDEGLTVLKEGIAGLYETSLLSQQLPADLISYPAIIPFSQVSPTNGSLNVTNSTIEKSVGLGLSSSSSGNVIGSTYTSLSFMMHLMDIPPQEDESDLLLKLERFAMPLQKREVEYSVLFSLYGYSCGDGGNADSLVDIRSLVKGAAEWKTPKYVPSSHLETRLLDASIAVIAATFSFQSHSVQTSLVSFCAKEAHAGFYRNVSSGSTSGLVSDMFSSEEERRKKERKIYNTTRTSVCLLSNIIESFPFASCVSFDDSELHWVRAAQEMLFERVLHCNLSIKAASANALSMLAGRIVDGSCLGEVFTKISVAIASATAAVPVSNLLSNDNLTVLSEYSGYMLTLGCIWTELHTDSGCKPDTRIISAISSVSIV